MTGWNPAHGGADLPEPPNFGAGSGPAMPNAHGATSQPVQGNWTGPWQDEHGQWHYPYGAHAPATEDPWAASTAAPAPVQQPLQPPMAQPYPQQYVPAAEPQPQAQPQQPVFVAPEQLEPVGPPRYYGPMPAVRDPRRNTMAAIITFVSLIIALWAILGFMSSLSKALSSISSGTDKLKLQVGSANAGLASLDEKTSNLNGMADDSKALKASLEGIDENMGAMLTGVDRIAAGMTAMDGSLSTLEAELGKVNEINGQMAGDLATINDGLAEQKGNVAKMRSDVVGTATVLKQIPGRLKVTNARLTHVNGVVNYMGCSGILNNLQVKIFLGPINNGTAKVVATVIPPGAWGTKADGTPC